MQQYERAARGFDDTRYLTAARIERQSMARLMMMDAVILVTALFFVGGLFYIF